MAAASAAGTFDLHTLRHTHLDGEQRPRQSRGLGLQHARRQGERHGSEVCVPGHGRKADRAPLLQASPHLGIDNVEVLKNTVSASSSKLVAFNTLAEAMESFWTGEPLNTAQEEEQAHFLVSFWDELVKVRHEFGRLGKSDRQALRGTSMAGTALSVHGMIAVADALRTRGLDPSNALKPLSEPVLNGGHKIDYFSYDNDVWLKIGALALAENRRGEVRKTLRMSFQTREAVGDELKRRIGLGSD